jgi:poly(3-hydroxybutyrate) depolymerase
MKKLACSILLAVLAGGSGSALDLPRGQIIDDVVCVDDPGQHYSLYLPSSFSPDRAWPVILAFDAGGRGRRGVERYQAGAERYGYIVAGSNNSRNGPWKPSLDAARAMATDVTTRFPIDSRRIYAAGMSGGARVAMMVALHPELMAGRDHVETAGVFASSAGFPPGEFRDSVPFPVFATAGTDDFNYIEVRTLDRALKGPRRVVIFEGGHAWLPVETATEGIEWMELQGMASGIRPRNQPLIDDLFARRVARAEALKNGLDLMRELQSIVRDFSRFKDVTELNRRAAAVAAQPDTIAALNAERDDQTREEESTAAMLALLEELDVDGGIARLKARAAPLLEQARASADSPSRRIARRVLTTLRASTAGIRNVELQELLDQISVAVAR